MKRISASGTRTKSPKAPKAPSEKVSKQVICALAGVQPKPLWQRFSHCEMGKDLPRKMPDRSDVATKTNRSDVFKRLFSIYLCKQIPSIKPSAWVIPIVVRLRMTRATRKETVRPALVGPDMQRKRQNSLRTALGFNQINITTFGGNERLCSPVCKG